MLTELESYTRFCETTDKFIKLIDACIPEIYEMDRDLEKILEAAKEKGVPGIDIAKQSIHATLLSIMASVKSNRSNYISLRARIDAIDKFINLSSGS
jgi:hypothetical protein